MRKPRRVILEDDDGNVIDNYLVFNEHKERPWQRLGTRLPQGADAEEIVEAAGLDWRVELGPVFDDLGCQIPGYYLIYRSIPYKPCGMEITAGITPEKRIPFGITETELEPLQNIDIFRHIEKYIGKNHGCWETAGILEDGKAIFGSLYKNALPGMSLVLPNGERLESYLLVVSMSRKLRYPLYYLCVVRPTTHCIISSKRVGLTSNQYEHVLADIHRECSYLVSSQVFALDAFRWLGWIDSMTGIMGNTQFTIWDLAREGRGADAGSGWGWYCAFAEWFDGIHAQRDETSQQEQGHFTVDVGIFGVGGRIRERARGVLIDLIERREEAESGSGTGKES